MTTLCPETILRRTERGRGEVLFAHHDLTRMQRRVLSVVTGHTELGRLFGHQAHDAVAAAAVLLALGLLETVEFETDDLLPDWRGRLRGADRISAPRP